MDLSENIFPNKWFPSFGNLLWLKHEQVVIKAREMANEIFWRLDNINFMIQFSAEPLNELLDIHLFKATDKLEMLLKLLRDDVESLPTSLVWFTPRVSFLFVRTFQSQFVNYKK